MSSRDRRSTGRRRQQKPTVQADTVNTVSAPPVQVKGKVHKDSPSGDQCLALYKPKSNEEFTGVKRMNKLIRGSSTKVRMKIFTDPTPFRWITFFILFTIAVTMFFLCAYEWIYSFLYHSDDLGEGLNAFMRVFFSFMRSYNCVGFALLFSFSLMAWSIAL